MENGGSDKEKEYLSEEKLCFLGPEHWNFVEWMGLTHGGRSTATAQEP